MSDPSPRQFRLAAPLPAVRSPRAAEVARWFALQIPPCPSRFEPSAIPPLPASGQILLITGPSGSGKSLLLNRYRTRAPGGPRCIDLHRLRLPQRPLVDCLPALSTADTLRALAEVGLGEAWTCLRMPAELSEGQRWRLRLAIALHRSRRLRRPGMLLADEFAALLDRVSACIVARVVRRCIARQPGLCAVLATSHDDLAGALCPDLHLHCDFGEVFEVRPVHPAV
jgi:ABC-type glutathione transport system ATPase component